MSISKLLVAFSRRSKKAVTKTQKQSRLQHAIELLEDRLVPTVYYWKGGDAGGATNWNIAANWSDSADGSTPGAVPTATDEAYFNSTAVAPSDQVSLLGADQAVQKITFANIDPISILSTGGYTLTVGAGGIEVLNSTTAPISIAATVSTSVAASFLNNSTSTFTLGGTINYPNQLTLGGSGTFVISGPTSGAGTAGLKVDGAWLQVSDVASLGPAGNTLTLNSGKFSSDSGTARAVSLPLVISGSVTLGDATKNGSLTFNGSTQQLTGSNPTLTVNGGVTTFNTSTFTLNTSTNSFTIVTDSVGGAVSFNTGLTYAGGQTINTSGVGNIKFQAPIANPMIGTVSPSLTFTGSATKVFLGDTIAVTGTTGLVTVNGPTVTFGVSTSTFIGGVKIQSGVAIFAAGSTVGGGAVTQGPIGIGDFEIAGGTIRTDAAVARAINNNLTISNSFSFSSQAGLANITFDPTGVTVPAPGTITLSSASTITALNNVLTLTGPISGSNSPLNIRGFGQVTLTNASVTASALGNVTVGENAAAGALGGRLNVSSQNAMGAGSYTLNYGATLNPAGNFSPTNQITINTGGNYNPTGASGGITAFTNASNSTIQSGGAITNASGQTLSITVGTGPSQVSLPTAGLLNITGSNIIALTGAYPSLTGTLVFGGGTNGSASIATTAPTTLSSVDGSDRTISFSNYNNGTGAIGRGSAFAFNGLVLNANLTLAGGSNYGTLSNSPQNANFALASLGAVTETGSARSITANLAPAGIVALTATPTGWTGGTTINNGTLQINAAGTSARQLGTGGLTLNGGVLRVFGSSTTTVQDLIVVGVRGGTLETYSNGGGNITFSGDITKAGGVASPSGPLTLRYDYATNTSGSPVINLSGNNVGFDSGFVLAANGNRGRIMFNSIAATGSDGTGAGGNTSTVNTITVPNGVMFGFNSLATLTSTIGKFATSAGAVLNLTNLTGSNINLNALNKDIRLGNFGSLTYSGTYTPFSNTFKFSSSSGTLTLGTANQLTGANNLDVSGVPVAAGAHDSNNEGSPNNSGTPGVVAITATQNFSGTTTVTGVIRNAAMGLQDGFDTGTNSANSYFSRQTLSVSANVGSTSGITVERTGILTITGGTSGAANVPIVVRGLGVLNNTVSNGLTATGTLTLGGTSGGGTFATTTSTTQSLTSLTVSGGINSITGNGGLTLTGPAASAYTRTAGGSLNVALPTNTGFTNLPASSSVIGGILVGAVITTGTTAADFVAAASGVMAAPVYTTQSAAASWGAGQNITNTNNTTVLSGTTPNTALAINSLRNYGSSTNSTVTLGAPLTVNSGMILQAAANTLAINSSTLQSGNGQDLAIHVNQGTLQIGSQIVGGLPLTKSGGGTLTLNAANTIGDLYLSGGVLNASTAGALGPVAGTRTWYLQGGNLNFAVNPNTGGSPQYANVNLVANPATNGTFIFVESPFTPFNVVIGGPTTTVTMNSYLGINTAATGANNPGTLTLAGKLSGPGALATSRSNNASGRSVTVLSNDNSNWSGGVFLRNGAQFRFANAKAFGTGPIVNASNPGSTNYLPGIVSLIVTDAATGVMNVSNDFSLNGTIALGNWKTDLSAGAVVPLNLSGKIMGSGGLLLQGVVTAGNVSETVLSGTVSMAGVPGIYSYGETNAIQNFVNGPGGISLGATNYQNSLSPLTISSSSLVDMPGAMGTVATRGALGFVRFSADSTGAQNSFIPGQVGPGYLAALHQAADTVNQTGNFGYLLTGSSTIAAASWSAGTVTITTAADHGLTVGQQVVITGMTPSAYNGTYAVVSASGATFTYALVADPGTATVFGNINGNGVFALPEGKSILIGSLGLQGAGVGQVGGVLGSAGGGTSLLTGSAKLPGFDAGDVNIHANAVSDSQTLNLLARNVADTFQIGDTGSKVVISPTYGDSGATTTITLLSTRTGATMLNKTGLGTVIVKNAEFNTIAGAANSAKASFTFNVNAGTLEYDQVDTGASFAALNVNNGGKLRGTGKVNSNVVINASGTLAPGVAVGTTLGVNGDLSLAGSSEFRVVGAAATADKVDSVANLTYGGVLKISGTGFVSGDSWDLFDFTTQSGSFTNNAVFGTSGDGTNLPSLAGGLFWQFNYASGVLQVVGAPTITSVVPVIGPTTGGTIVNIYGSNFVSVSSVAFGSTVFTPSSFTVTGTTQITVTSPSNLGVPGTADIVVTNPAGAGSLAGSDDFTYATPAVATVVVNGGPGVVLGGSTWSLAGQNSVVKQIVVTFNQAVTLASDAFTVTAVPINPSGGAGFVKVNGGATPSSDPVTASIAATLSPSSYLITFSGAGTHDGGIIKSGVYDLNTIAAKVSANGETMASDQKSTFFAMFGTINANDSLSVPPGGFIGDGFSKAFVDPGSLFQFSDAFGSVAATPAGPPAYSIIFDANLDGFVDPGDLFAFSDSFGIDWSF